MYVGVRKWGFRANVKAIKEAAGRVDREPVCGAGDRYCRLSRNRGERTGCHPRQAQIVELRFFGGMSIPEIARLLSLSPETVKRDWAMARTWLPGGFLCNLCHPHR